MNFKKNQKENFRNNIGTLDKNGVRKWIYPRIVKGFYYNMRTYLSFILIFLFFLFPFIKIQGDPFFKFDILKNEFFIFSFPFYPQDFPIIALGIIMIIIFICLFTITYGRIFCGWLCPQTIFLEMVFRKIEYAIEGDRGSQLSLNKQPWNKKKIKKKLLKWIIFALLSLIISHIFFAYILGLDFLIKIIKQGPQNHIIFFISIFFNTCIIYFVYSWFREQACTLVCPYGRLQSVLVDKNTILVNYDYKRGESKLGIRHKFKKGENRKLLDKGDCIDCNQCVEVCPTGIDIRNGVQLECINCTSCIDACNNIMEKIKLPKGLIRYTSEEQIITSVKKSLFNGKKLIYTILLSIIILLFIIIISFKNTIDIKFLRVPGSQFFFLKKEFIVNPYEYTVINKSSKELKLKFKIISHNNGKILFPYNNKKDSIIIKKRKTLKGYVYLLIPIHEINNTNNQISIAVYNQTKKHVYTCKTNFLGPFNF